MTDTMSLPKAKELSKRMIKLKFMQQALIQSYLALPNCLPNPPVGCVIVRENKIIAVGHTHAPGFAHAEADAMEKVDGNLNHCEIYVTLEPCSFHGRTPSCALEMLKRRVSRVYVAMLDPHPRNRGKGIALLRNTGVIVEVKVGQKEVASFISPWLYPHKKSWTSKTDCKTEK